MLRKFAVMLLAIAAFSFAGFAQDHPNFTGTWKLNTAKSNPGQFGPSARTDVITQDGSKITDKVTSSSQQGDLNYAANFVLDGTKVVVPPDSPQATMGMLTIEDLTASWDGPAFLLVTDANVRGQVEVTSKQHYTLSADGKTMTVDDHVSTSMGDIDTQLIFDKQ
jgi:hypothetical protein